MASEDVSIDADVTEVTLPTINLNIPIALRDFSIEKTSTHGPIAKTYTNEPIAKTYTNNPITKTSRIISIAATGVVGD